MKNQVRHLTFLLFIISVLFSCKKDNLSDIIGTSRNLNAYEQYVADVNTEQIKKGAFATSNDDGYVYFSYEYTGEYYYAAWKNAIIINKKDKAGELKWSLRYSYEEKGIKVGEMVSLPDGSVVIAATIEKAVFHGPNAAHFAMDIILVKIDTNGKLVWQKTFDYNRWDRANSVGFTNDGGLIIGASTEIDDGTVNSISDWLIIKTDENGEKQWIKTTRSKSGSERISEILQNSEHNYIATIESFPDGLSGSPNSKIVLFNQNGDFISYANHSYGFFWSEQLIKANDGGSILFFVHDRNNPKIAFVKINDSGLIVAEESYEAMNGAPFNTYNYRDWPKGLWAGNLLNTGYFVLVREDSEDPFPELGNYSILKFNNSGKLIE